ncbi:hypothetical protein P692DRAFT_20866539 [Suillus brevipes Sb2]|nr:hypothetical protein P692DRAFT_20866539 [Suillus brevipes Sb2]
MVVQLWGVREQRRFNCGAYTTVLVLVCRSITYSTRAACNEAFRASASPTRALGKRSRIIDELVVFVRFVDVFARELGETEGHGGHGDGDTVVPLRVVVVVVVVWEAAEAAAAGKVAGEKARWQADAAVEVGDEMPPPGLADEEGDDEGDEKDGEDVLEGGRVVRRRLGGLDGEKRRSARGTRGRGRKGIGGGPGGDPDLGGGA